MHDQIRRVGTGSSVRPGQILDAARTAAVNVAETAMAVFASGRWATTMEGQQAYALATQILVLEAEMGPVCHADFAARHIRTMAEAAHLLVQTARMERDAGNAMISRIVDAWLIDCQVDQLLVPAYAIVAIAV